MTKFVAAGGPAGVVVCAFLSAAGAAWAQDSAPSSDAVPAEPAAATSEDSTALPKVVVTTPKEKKKKSTTKKVSGKTGGEGSSDGGATGQAAQQDAGGLGGAVDSETKIDGLLLGGPAISDTGTSVFDSQNVRMRTDGSGDANTFLRNLPNVQYQNDTDTSAGVNLQDTIDTRPLLLSINGGRSYENNFILNGVSINSVTGPVERQSVEMTDSDDLPNADLVYGLHPQTVFVPSEFIGTATVIDSNASAEYGDFRGGVVMYDLARPPTDRYRASVTYSRETDEMMNYILGTPGKINPLDRKAPTFEKNNLAVSVGAPITTDLSFIAQASRKTAETQKQKDYELYSGWVDEESDNTFLRFATALKTDIGRFTFDTSHTLYSQTWQSPGWRDLEMDVQTNTSSTQIEYLGALRGIASDAIGLGGVTLKARAFYNDSETLNDAGDNYGYAWVASRQTRNSSGVMEETFRSHLNDDWCRPVPSEAAAPGDSSNNTMCYEGGYGTKEQDQTDYGIQAQLKGDVLLGNFLIGGEAKSTEGRRARLEDYTYYSSFVTATGYTSNPKSPTSGSFTCPPNDPVCTVEQYGRIKTVWDAFDISETVNTVNGFAEIDQTLGWFNVRAGVRVDYEDYFKNLNIAPRLAGTVTPFRGLSFTGGFNRYYAAESLAFALRDAQPRAKAYTRSHDTTTGVVSGTWSNPSTTYYSYREADLDTPFTDEYTGAVRIRDPLLGGQWRFRYLERYGEDLYNTTRCGSNCKELTNEGESFYRSASAEYTKFWYGLSNAFQLSGAGITAGLTWSEQSISRATYIEEDDNLDYIYYNGKSYTPQSFVEVTGNLDIPVRIGGTVTTSWFNDRLLLNVSAGYNLGYDGVYATDEEIEFEGNTHVVYKDRKFDPTLLVDLSGQFALTEQAAIEFHVNNVLNSAGNAVASTANPWLRGRSYWVGSTVRF